MFKKVLTMILPLLLSVGIFAQTRVAGTVADSGGEPLAGVAVFTQVGASTVSALTDEDGNFSIEVPEGSVLTFSMMGFATRLVAASEKMNVVLDEERNVLDESVVIGYGTVKKKDLLGSVSTVREQSLQDRKSGGVIQSMQGLASGVP